MTADWYLFWKQHAERPEVSPWELEMGMLQHGLEVMATMLKTAVMPAFEAMAKSIEKFNRATNLQRENPLLSLNDWSR